MTKLFLDVDGVVNAIAPHSAWSDYTTFPLQGAVNNRINYSPDMLRRLADYDMTLHWTTAWEEAAPQVLAPMIGFGENRPWLSPLNGIMDYPTILWKREAVEAHVKHDPCRFVWMDDEMRLEDMEWAQRHNGLAIRPPTAHGITRPQIALIAQFLESPITVLI